MYEREMLSEPNQQLSSNSNFFFQFKQKYLFLENKKLSLNSNLLYYQS